MKQDFIQTSVTDSFKEKLYKTSNYLYVTVIELQAERIEDGFNGPKTKQHE